MCECDWLFLLVPTLDCEKLDATEEVKAGEAGEAGAGCVDADVAEGGFL